MRNNRQSRSAIAVLAAIALIALSCGDGESDTPTQPSPSGPAVTTSVSVVDNSFNPSSNQVSAGETVTWSWRGSNQHNVTFDDTSLGTSATKATGTFQQTFANTGVFTYFCTVHGRAVMSGSVSVGTAEQAEVRDSSGGGYP